MTMLAHDREKALGLRSAFEAMEQGDDAATQNALQALIQEARIRLGVSPRPDDEEWFDLVSEHVMHFRHGSTELRAELLFQCAFFYYTRGKIPLGITTAERGIAVANEGNHQQVLRQLWTVLGALHSMTRDRANELIAHWNALEIAEALQEREGLCKTFVNLAVARYNAGMLDESIALNRKAIELAAGDPALAYVEAPAQHNIALAALTLADWATAEESIERALKVAIEPRTAHDAYNRAVWETTCTKIMVKAGKHADAREHAEAARRYAAMSGSGPAQAQAEIAQAWIENAAGQTDIALTRCAQLAQTARTYEPAQRDLLEVQVTILHQAKRHAEAEAMFRRYLEHLSKWQRQSSMQQLAVLKRAFVSKQGITAEDLGVLDAALRERILSGELDIFENFREQLEALAVLAELRDDATGEHAYRVGRIASIVAKRMGYDEDKLASIEIGARLHDIGKLAIPDVVLQKRARLVAVEVEVMRTHAEEGHRILAAIGHPVFELAGRIARHHHEWWDGSGYPQRLSGEAIPEEARITALADVYDALTHERPYKKAWPVDVSLEEIESLSGTQFDPTICREFLRVMEELISRHGPGLDAFLGQDAAKSKIVMANRSIERATLRGRSRTLLDTRR